MSETPSKPVDSPADPAPPAIEVDHLEFRFVYCAFQSDGVLTFASRGH